MPQAPRMPVCSLSAPAQDNILLMRITWKGCTRMRKWKESLPEVLVTYLFAQIRAASRASDETCSYSSETKLYASVSQYSKVRCEFKLTEHRREIRRRWPSCDPSRRCGSWLHSHTNTSITYSSCIIPAPDSRSGTPRLYLDLGKGLFLQ